MDPLQAISPVDGRYRKHAEPLAAYMSEQALMRYRVAVEVEYLIALSDSGLTALRRLSDAEKETLKGLASGFSSADAEAIKAIEAKTNHDVKAVEYFLKDKLKETTLADVREWIHFGLTSEDVNNVAYALMLRGALEELFAPVLCDIGHTLDAFAERHAGTPMLARTHGQPATPTTFGKEMKVFTARFRKQAAGIANHVISVKFSGASGNWNAHVAAYPGADWVGFSRKFVERFNAKEGMTLTLNAVTTQIEPHDTYAELFDNIRRLNSVFIDLAEDLWRYISDGWLVQKPKEGEVGSSTMPHKVNPIDFENAEGNLGIANALFEFFARKLPVSRLQRDLSDSTVERAFGTALAHSLVAYKSLLRCLGKVSVNEKAMREALAAHPEVIAEGIQTILRAAGAELPYEKLRDLTRGREVKLEDIHNFIDSLDVAPEVKEKLRGITPENYLGLAEKLAGE